MIIYKLTNITNGKVYIGQTVKTLNQRWSAHCYNKSDTFIGRAIYKYGRTNFSKEVIDTSINLEDLNKKEIFWISHYKSNYKQYGYNLTTGGDNFRHSTESKKIMSDKAKARPIQICSEETRAKMSLASKGKKKGPMKDSTKKKLSEINKGKAPVVSVDQGKRISLAKKGIPMTQAHKEALKKAWIKRKQNKENK